MSDYYYDPYHRWEPLAEFHFNLDNDEDHDECNEENYLYCLCSRAFIRDGIKYYYVDKDVSESEAEVVHDSQSQELDDHSHVHFSVDTYYKVKCEKDEAASCYCSASHTDNCCSTDEHDAAQIHGSMSHALQPSDSGADLTYQDYHSDITTNEKLEKMEHDFIETNEDYLSEDTWDKFWAVNGERLIWASWIKTYSDYINPAYLGENNEVVMDDSGIPKQNSADQIFKEPISKKTDDSSIRERKFSYDSKVNPYKKSNADKNVCVKHEVNKDDQWLPIQNRRRSCSEHDRILSPRTVTGTDSMTNVTKMTFSSYDVTSSHVTSNSTPTDDYSVSSSTSDDQSNDQTRIANVDENLEQIPSEELDTEQYWQFLWKKHFGEQYALHYSNYVHKQGVKSKALNDNDNIVIVAQTAGKPDEKNIDVEYENSEGNSQETPTIIEVQTQKPQAKEPKPKKKNKRSTNRYVNSVGTLLQSLLKEEQKKIQEETETSNSTNTDLADLIKETESIQVRNNSDKEEELENTNDTKVKNIVESIKSTKVTESFKGKEEEDTSEYHSKSGNNTVQDLNNVNCSTNSNVQQSASASNFSSYNYDEGDDDPPEETSLTLKRSHEVEGDEVIITMENMGFSFNEENMPKGQLVYRKRLGKLRPPRQKKMARKTYFDDYGNPCDIDPVKDVQEEKEALANYECAALKINLDTQVIPNAQMNEETHAQTSDLMIAVDSYDVQNKEASEEENDIAIDVASIPLPSDIDSLSDFLDDDEQKNSTLESSATQQETPKRKRRQKRHSRLDDEYYPEIPPELRDSPKMKKYWKKRHSLFHRFDEGIKLDRESWFSVTPENIARHIATKCVYDTVLDAFCGAGGNTIQFAAVCKKVIAIDIDPDKIEMAKHNATVYGVVDRIQFIVGDFFELADTIQADMVFLSPPWGGPNYTDNAQYDLETMLRPRPASELMSVAREISPTIAFYLPRNSKIDQILSLAKEVGGSVEVEQSYLDKRFIAITAYYY